MASYASDPGLLEGLRKADSAAFREVYVLHFNMIKYFILKNNGREEDANDIFQEAMVVLFQQLKEGKFELKSSLKTWIYAVCRHKWLKHLEKQKRNVRLTDFEQADEIVLPENLDTGENSKSLRKSLEQLDMQCKKLLLLYYYFKKSMEEIAADLNYTNADNAKSQKYKCLQKLKAIHLSSNKND